MGWVCGTHRKEEKWGASGKIILTSILKGAGGSRLDTSGSEYGSVLWSCERDCDLRETIKCGNIVTS